MIISNVIPMTFNDHMNIIHIINDPYPNLHGSDSLTTKPSGRRQAWFEEMINGEPREKRRLPWLRCLKIFAMEKAG